MDLICKNKQSTDPRPMPSTPPLGSVAIDPHVLQLKQMLEENYSTDTWMKSVREVANPFGDGRAARRIVRIIEEKFGVKAKGAASVRQSLF